MKLVPFTARSLVTDNVPPTLVFPEAATTSNLFVSTVKLPPTPKVPPTVAASDKVVTPVTPNVPPTVAASDKVVTPVTPNVPPTVALSDIVVTPVTPNVPAIVAASDKVVTPVTPSAPPTVAWLENVTAPVTPNVPAIEVLPVPAVTTNLSVFIFVSPVTNNCPSVLISPVVAAIIALLVPLLNICNPLLKTAPWAKVEVLLAVNTPSTVRLDADVNEPPFVPILVKDGKVVIAPCEFSVTVAAVPLTLPVTLATILPVDFIAPVTLRSPLNDASPITSKRLPKDTSLSTNNLFSIWISIP